MKRIFTSICALTLVAVLLLSGCRAKTGAPQIGSSVISSSSTVQDTTNGSQGTAQTSSIGGSQSQVQLPIGGGSSKPSSSNSSENQGGNNTTTSTPAQNQGSSKPNSSTGEQNQGNSKPNSSTGVQGQGSSKPNSSAPAQSQGSSKPASSPAQSQTGSKPASSSAQTTTSSATSSAAKPNSSVVETPEVLDLEPVASKNYILYNALSAKQKTAYTNILNAVTALDRSEKFLVGNNITTRDAAVALNAVRGDYPQIFWLPNVYGIAKSGTSVYLAFCGSSGNTVYDYTVKDAADLNNKQKQLNDKVKAAVKAVVKSNMSDYQMELALHDWLCANMTYDNTPTAEEHSWDAYGALVNGSGVCEAYTKAFQLLLYTVGINNRLIFGASKDDAQQAHVWNLVKVGGSWYHTDVTWDDQKINKFDYIHLYFNQTQENFKRTHTMRDTLNNVSDDVVSGGQFNFAYPNATATAANYYRMSGTYIEKEDDFKTTVLKAFEGVTTDTAVEFYYAADTSFSDAKLGALLKEQNVISQLNRLTTLSSCSYGALRDKNQPFFFIRMLNKEVKK